MGPRILGVAVVQINFIVNTILALSLPEGSVSAVTLAFTLMLMPQVAIAQSAAIAAMPTFSAQVALGKLDELRGALAATLRSVSAAGRSCHRGADPAAFPADPLPL